MAQGWHSTIFFWRRTAARPPPGFVCGGSARREPEMAPHGLRASLIFSDCRVNSARLVIENILDAEARGAVVANYVEVQQDADGAVAMDALSGEQFRIRARRIVNATGPWSGAGHVRLVRGSHLIFPRIQAGSRAIAHFDDDGRIVFLIPWGEADNLTLVGTTEVDHHGSPDHVRISKTKLLISPESCIACFPSTAPNRLPRTVRSAL